MKTVSRKLLRRERGYEIWREMSLLEYDVEVINDAGDPEGANKVVDALENASGRLSTVEFAYTPDGGFIGSEDMAKRLTGKGIQPELINGHKVCSIGFCKQEQKWYGWSHRAVFGFGVGSNVKRGDCGYTPTDKEDYRCEQARFWDNAHHKKTWAREVTENGVTGVRTFWRYTENVPNKKLRGTIGGLFHAYPTSWGRGEWTAHNPEDAKQMATDFANGVA